MMRYRTLFVLLAALPLLTLAEAPSGNLFVNSSMEQWHSSGIRPRAWGVWAMPYHIFQVQPDREVVADSAMSMRIDTRTYANVYQTIQVTPGETYTMSASVKVAQKTRLTMKFSVHGSLAEGVNSEGVIEHTTLAPGDWQRVSLTGTMPEGAERAVVYYCFSGAGTYWFDQAMCNRGELADYTHGLLFTPLAPLNREAQPGEVTMTPTSWDADGKVLRDQSVAMAFDTDILSSPRLSLPTPDLPKHIGVRFDTPATVRGLSVLLAHPHVPEGVALYLSVCRNNQWERLPVEVQTVGPALYLDTGYKAVQAIRLELLPTDPEANLKAPAVYHVGILQ